MSDSMASRSDASRLRHAEHEANARIALALSILQHRSFCPACHPHADQTRLALLGATVEELARGVA
jgi:hypothetical protein